MVLIQLNLPNYVDKKLKYYMIDNDIKDKKTAIIEIIDKKLYWKYCVTDKRDKRD